MSVSGSILFLGDQSANELKLPPQRQGIQTSAPIKDKDLEYNRNITKKLFIYRLTFALMIIGIYFIIVSKTFFYFLFVAILYFITDFIFPLREFAIDDDSLRICRFFGGGLFKTRIRIQKKNIFEITDVDIGITTDSIIDFEYAIFAPGFGDNQRKKYELYRIRYLNELGLEKAIKISLSQIEVDSLSMGEQPPI